jgi:hypothetical protein
MNSHSNLPEKCEELMYRSDSKIFLEKCEINSLQCVHGYGSRRNFYVNMCIEESDTLLKQIFENI